ncbi:MAG: glycoside hydrolase family 5 protein [Candidatus Dormibacteria bacterium]
MPPLALTPALTTPASAVMTPIDTNSVLYRRTMAELDAFTTWLHNNCAQGMVGEIGWPDRPSDSGQWNSLAADWLGRAQAAGLWVAVWTSKESVGTGHQLEPYESAAPGLPISLADVQSAVMESHRSTGPFIDGMNAGDGEMGFPQLAPTSPLSNLRPGTYGVDYSYLSLASYRYLASRGVTVVRIPFRWERIQPTPGGPLSVAAVAQLRATVADAEASGMRVILDLHNFGSYFVGDPATGIGYRAAIGSPRLPVADLGDFWSRMSQAFGADPGVLAYDLMNEPIQLPHSSTVSSSQLWELASQSALSAIRAGGDQKTVLVAGYQWSGLENWLQAHPTGWIQDPAHNFRYEGHHYWDTDHTSRYLLTYQQEEKSLETHPPTVAMPAPSTTSCG